ncbi:unnamed protein product [marine sediment metagenome]|uniref:Uncharacterized protein n=1 Tax=marine sediment metagenome TaxID=412755 RepID=X1T3S5_9ZZZZ
MALVKTASDILTIRGRFGGVYFKKDPGGQHVQAMPRVVRYARSPAQVGEFGEKHSFSSSGIQGYSGACALWQMALLAFFGAAWAAYGLFFWFVGEDGEKKKATGFNWFLYYALAFPECERPPFWQPPHAPGDLPNHIVTYKGMWTYEHSPTEWPAESPSGYYWEVGEWNEQPRFATDDALHHLWWDGEHWVLSLSLGVADPATTFFSPGAEIHDWYYNPETKNWSHVYLGRPAEVP